MSIFTLLKWCKFSCRALQCGLVAIFADSLEHFFFYFGCVYEWWVIYLCVCVYRWGVAVAILNLSCHCCFWCFCFTIICPVVWILMRYLSFDTFFWHHTCILKSSRQLWHLLLFAHLHFHYYFQEENLSAMNTDPLYSAYHYSHPPLVERLAALDDPDSKKED